MEIDKGLATLVAALIAAILSLINLFFKDRSESKAAYRELLNEDINDLSSAIHEVLAISNIIVKTSTLEALSNWTKKAENAKSKLNEIRLKTRYSLYGIENGLRTLSRLPDWAQHKRNKPDEYKILLKLGGNLKYWMDYSIRKCYFNGRYPTLFERLMVTIMNGRIRSAYSKLAKKTKSNRR